MKKITKIFPFVIVVMGMVQVAKAQQGFGTNNPAPSSVVDMTATNKGTLLPRVALTSIIVASPIAAPADALTVFNTATAGSAPNNVTPGYYYWSATQSKWIRLLDNQTEPWFVGGTTNQATLNTQNIYQMGKVGIGSSNPYSALTIVNDNKADSFDDISIETFGTGSNTPAFIHMAAGGTLFSPTSLSNGAFLGSMYFRGFLSDNQYHTLSGIQTKYKGDGTTKLSNMEFYTSNASGAADPKMILTENGNLGVGVNNPIERLEVGNGNVRVHDINAAYTLLGTDKVVIADNTGVLRAVPTTALAVEPWQIQGGTLKATANTDNIYQQGSVAIGIASGASIPAAEVTAHNPKLYINGNVSITGSYYTTNSVYADYVFEKYFGGKSDINPSYEFKSLNYVRDFIKANNHLPGVTSIADLKKANNGYSFDMTKLTVQSLEKIEELYLHTIEQKDIIDQQQKEIETIKSRLDRLEKLLLKENK